MYYFPPLGHGHATPSTQWSGTPGNRQQWLSWLFVFFPTLLIYNYSDKISHYSEKSCWFFFTLSFFGNAETTESWSQKGLEIPTVCAGARRVQLTVWTRKQAPQGLVTFWHWAPSIGFSEPRGESTTGRFPFTVFTFTVTVQNQKAGKAATLQARDWISELTYIPNLHLHKTLLSQTCFSSSISTGKSPRSCFPKMTNTTNVQRYKMWLVFLLPLQQIRKSKAVMLQRTKKKKFICLQYESKFGSNCSLQGII